MNESENYFKATRCILVALINNKKKISVKLTDGQIFQGEIYSFDRFNLIMVKKTGNSRHILLTWRQIISIEEMP